VEKKLFELTHNFIERDGDIYIHRKAREAFVGTAAE
jgi:hypothetical protein